MILTFVVALLLGVDSPADLQPRLRPLPPMTPREEPPLKVRPDPSVFLPDEPEPAPERMGDARAVAGRVEAALAQDPALAQQHRGYLRYLNGHPEMARAEEAWWDITRTRAFGAAAEAMDEALLGDLQVQTLLDQFYDEMARDGKLRAVVEALFHAELAQTPRGRRLSGAYDFLRANPDVATQLLDNPKRESLLPEQFQGLADYLGGQPALMEAMRQAFVDLMDAPNAHTRAFPWWEAVAALEGTSGSAFAAISEQFHEHPHRFWVWHQRNLRLAEDVQARAWIRYWHRKVRRDPGLSGAYADYLAHIRETPAVAKAAELRWAASALGEPAPWPPKVAPPRLTPRTTDPAANAPDEMPRMPTITRPRRPSSLRPGLPRMPSMPSRPERPPRPQRPEVKGPSEMGGASE